MKIWRRKICFFAEKQEKTENIWRKKVLFCEGEEKRKEKEDNIWRRNIFGEVKYIFPEEDKKRKERRRIFG